MNISQSVIKNGKFFKTSLSVLLFNILFWLIKRYNKTNKVVNVWKRSGKDLTVYGVSNEVRADISKDGRVRIRWQTWAIYIGQPQTLKPVK